jgi:uncharacterized tellurite resistance protein B-like protein
MSDDCVSTRNRSSVDQTSPAIVPAMFDALLKFFTEPALAAPTADPVPLLVAALLVEAANCNDRFPEAERQAIRRILAERFPLTAPEVDRLLAAADQATAESVQLFRFTDGLAKGLGPEQKVRVIEMLWEVAYADGVLTALEDQLIRQVAGLLIVPDRDRGAARLRVMARLGLTGA